MANNFSKGKQHSQQFHDYIRGTTRSLLDGIPELGGNISQVQAIRARNDYSQAGGRVVERIWLSKRPSRTKIGCIIIWVLLLWWGEKRVFTNSVSLCEWETWEQWPSAAVPHHVVLIADPQLVDPHTYPGRPWPLSMLTVRHTDQYLRRAFSSVQRLLNPETVFFLGDIFDGGREWATKTEASPEKRWKKYGVKFWLREYDRFHRIFVDNWNLRSTRGEIGGVNRKFIASLPGNHDLGISNGIRLSVRDRFNTFFGDGNRVDIIGNHTFVSVDSVSFSAKNQPVQNREALKSNEEIWNPTEHFLSQARDLKIKVLDRHLRARFGKSDMALLDHTVLDIGDPNIQNQSSQTSPNVKGDLPTILLTHVPLYRPKETSCGPLRENGDALVIAAGYQYQNVLHPDLSKELIERIGNVEYVFSGDDHDYCETIHRGFTSKGGGVREVTVKSMSWAMGVRKPGFLMLSLWMPIDEQGNILDKSRIDSVGNDSSTLKSHLCLLPDQLSIFIRYGLLLGLTLFVLALRALSIAYGFRVTGGHILPINKPYDLEPEFQRRDRAYSKPGASSSNSMDSVYNNGLAVRSSAGRIRSVSPASGYGIPMTANDKYVTSNGIFRPENDEKPPGTQEGTEDGRSQVPLYKSRKRVSIAWKELKQSLMQVAAVGILFYTWLAYTH